MMTDKKSWIPDDVGGGYIRGDVQEAIRRELDYRLGEGDAPGALKRWEKELILAAINMMKPNFSLSILHSQAAIKAGATIQQVRDVLLSRISTGIMRWKMAGQWALAAAEETAGQEATVEWSSAEKRRIDEIREEWQRFIHRELPNHHEKLARVSPALLDSYQRIRAIFVKHDGVIPLRLMELMVTSTDTSSPFTRGESPSHARAAIKAGATVTQVIETVALAMIEGGIPVYKTAGLECIEAAEEEAAGTTGVSSLTG